MIFRYLKYQFITEVNNFLIVSENLLRKIKEQKMKTNIVILMSAINYTLTTQAFTIYILVAPLKNKSKFIMILCYNLHC